MTRLLCPRCGYRLTKVEEDVREIEAEKAILLAELSHWNGLFVASKQCPHFHRLSCEWAGDISDANRIEFNGHEAAVGAGYKPCKTCCA